MSRNSGANVWGSDILSSPAVPGKCQACAIAQIYPVEITIIKSGAMIVRRSPQCRTFSRALIYEKSLSPLFPVGGVVVTNDWCITDKSFMESNLFSDFWSMLHTFLDSLSFQTFVLMQCIRLSLHDTINKLEIVLLQVALPSYGCSCAKILPKCDNFQYGIIIWLRDEENRKDIKLIWFKENYFE